MRRHKLKMLALGTLALTMILNTSPIHSQSNQVGMNTLKHHKTNQIITLRNNPIKVPAQMIQREEQFRGVWVSTVYNLDFPSKKGISKDAYKKEYIKLLDELENLNMNAVIFQVRPKLDTFYKSEINPWSEYLSGKQGKSPNWDPMEWMVEETHKREMEFHAWFNPYRVTTAEENTKSIQTQLSELSENNWARNNPQYVYRFAGRLYLNPGEPAVIEHINQSVMEVVENYDIDAVHFDDYFYPFKSSGSDWYFSEEKNTFNKYKGGASNVSDWRRDNVNNLVKKLHDSIEEHNKNKNTNVEFGISPFAIWGHKGSSNLVNRENGSYTPVTSGNSYNSQFADTRKWVKENWVDYIAPQVYWTFDEKAAPYAEIVHWWTDVVKDTDVNLYIGHANYRINSSWKSPGELCNQLKFNSQYEEIKGSIFFRYENLLKSKQGNTENDKFIDMLKNEHFKDKAKLPGKKDLPRPKEEQFALNVMKVKNGNILMWRDEKGGNKDYLIERVSLNDGEKVEIETLNSRRDTSFNGYFFDEDTKEDTEYKYTVSAVGVEKINNQLAHKK